MTLVESMFARKSGVSEVKAGTIVWCDVDIATIDDVQFGIFERQFAELGNRVYDANRVAVIGDHYLPASTPHQAEIEKAVRSFAETHGINNVFMTQGVKHQVLPEEGVVLPGRLVVATDSHTNTAGAFGALGIALGPSEVAVIFSEGKMWFRVPETIRIEFDGRFASGVTPKDAALRILGDRGTSFARYKALEFIDATGQIDMDGRMTLCNMSTEMGAKAAIFAADEVTRRFYRDRGIEVDIPETVEEDGDSSAERWSLDVSALEPLVAEPPSPSNVKPVRVFSDVCVDQAFIGSCANANYEDLQAAAAILKGRHVHPSVQAIVTPASMGIYRRALETGVIATLVEAGCVVTNPGCGACPGVHMGTLGAGHVRISSQNRNFIGRGGHKDSSTYVASAQTVAASAIRGTISDPREFVN